MKKEFNLSEKERYLGTGLSEDDCIFKKKDVKEFIRRLKKDLERDGYLTLKVREYIDTLAGDKLK